MNRGYGFQRFLLHGFHVLAGVSMLLAVTVPATAVENIRRVVWNQTADIDWAPGVSTTSVIFDADLTALEAAYAVTSFSIDKIKDDAHKKLTEEQLAERYKSWAKGLREKAYIEVRL